MNNNKNKLNSSKNKLNSKKKNAFLSQSQTQCVFGSSLKSQLILLFNLFLLLFIGPTALFSTIHEFHCTISINFYLYLQHFQ